ncbi:hypothetical protein QFZ28_003176 [Neobacillus niacini]|uniref:hypothetical protein n=1 Tax=Neobacillus niacini TaxID=86668 RepID=UPI0027807968|nr:hypothetical protein [Neobacillus niacini]MDQ1002776.1 hypothetical protein [Neobacillus niacini]
MGKVLSGVFSGCTVKANKKSLKIEHGSADLLNIRNIINCEVMERVHGYITVKVRYINKGFERESILQLSETEFQVLIVVLNEKSEKNIKVVMPLGKEHGKKQKKRTRTCRTCNIEKNLESFVVPENISGYGFICKECREESARKWSERKARMDDPIWKQIGFESREEFNNSFKGIQYSNLLYSKWKDGYEIIKSGKSESISMPVSNMPPAVNRWVGRVQRHKNRWIAIDRKGVVRVTGKTRDEAVENLFDKLKFSQRQSPESMSETFFTKVAGVTFSNEDGSDRQSILKHCHTGESLLLIPAPNPDHPEAIKVCRNNKEQLGWLKSHVAEKMNPLLKRGKKVTAVISELTGGTEEKPTKGCNIQITIDEGPSYLNLIMMNVIKKLFHFVKYILKG